MAHVFEFHECLGKGAYGEVYRVTMTSSSGLEKEVSAKVLRPNFRPNSEIVQRLRDEARLLSMLNHRAILRVHDLVVIDERLSLVTEYVSGQSLKECIYGADPIGLRAMLEVLAEVASALDAAYMTPSPGGSGTLRLVHRDLQPSALRVLPTGEVKVMDFGLARSPNMDREARTRVGAVVGNMSYVCPEWVTSGALGPTSDVFSLGCVLYETIARVKLLKGAEQRRLLFLADESESFDRFLAETLDEIAIRCARPVRELMAEMLAYDPDQRATSAVVQRLSRRLADQCEGPSLEQWCRQRAWPEPRISKGSWTGLRTHISSSLMGLTEERADTPAPPPSVPAPDLTESRLQPSSAPEEEPPMNSPEPLSDDTQPETIRQELVMGVMAFVLTVVIVLDVVVVGGLVVATLVVPIL